MAQLHAPPPATHNSVVSLVLALRFPCFQSSGLLASSSSAAPLFHRLLLDVRGLLDHTPDRGREAVQSVTIDYATYRYTVTLTPQFIIAVHVTQSAPTHTAHAADTGEVKEEEEDEEDGQEV